MTSPQDLRGRYRKREFVAVKPVLPPGSSVEDLSFEECFFSGCTFAVREGTFESPDRWARIVRLNVKDCRLSGCHLGPIILQDAIIDGLRTDDLHVWGAVYRRVVLRGRIGPLLIGDLVVAPAGSDKETAATCRAWTREHYARQTDFALDLSAAEFTGEVDLRGVPARLVRRDPETQAVVRKAKVLDRRYRQLDLLGAPWDLTIDAMFDPGEDAEDRVLIAPKRDRRFKKWLEAIRILRAEGIADPD